MYSYIQLYRIETYSYGTAPKVAFNRRRVPMNMPEEIRITDTSLRDEHKHQGIALMDELYGDADPVKETLYPVVVTMQTDGFLEFQIPGIPKVSCCHSDLPSGLEHIRESLCEEMLLSPVPLTPAPPPSLTQNQTVVYIKA